MPNPTREQIMQALWNLTDDVSWGTPSRTWKSKNRRVMLFSDVNSALQPFVCQAEWAENSQQTTRLPYKNTMFAKWIVYQATAKDKKTPGAIENNLILDAILAALAPKPSDPGYPDNRNTLGGLVHHVFVDGEVFKDPGDIDDQGMMIVPITILVP